jgi:flagellar biosynthesis chaperone FliJ
VWFGRARREAEQQLEAFRREHHALTERCSRSEAAVEAAQAQLASASAERAAERDAAQSQLATLTRERDAARTAAEVQVHEIGTELDKATSRLAELTSERDDLRTRLDRASAAAVAASGSSSAGSSGSSAVDDATWDLLLADLTRRWPVPVTVTVASAGETVGEVGAAASAVPDQLAEAFVRELERLREEVGVDAEITVVDTFAPARPVVFLLAALDLLGALTSTCQRVVVKLEDQLDMVGQDWEGRRDELDVARSRALAAGADVGPLEIDGDHIHLTLNPTATT